MAGFYFHFFCPQIGQPSYFFSGHGHHPWSSFFAFILARSEKSKFQLFATEFDDSLKKLSLEKLQHHLTPLNLANHTQRSLQDAKVPDRFLTGRWFLLQTCHTTNWNLPVVLFHATIQSLNSKVDMLMFQFPFPFHCHCHQTHLQTWCP